MVLVDCFSKNKYTRAIKFYTQLYRRLVYDFIEN